MPLIRPFVPARDFALSCAFYEAIGFRVAFRDERIAILDLDGAGLLLQDFYEQAFAENAMHQLFVDGLDEWWTRTDGLVERFGVRPPVTPADRPDWGLRVGFLFDPAGVLWHVTEPLGRPTPA